MQNTKHKKSIVGWWQLSVALVFLFNPNVGLVDFLPDFIGYMLLCRALSRLSLIDDRIDDAHRLLRRMVYITVARFSALFVTFGFVPYSDRATMMLLLSFVFDVMELYTVIPALLKLSDGILYLSERHGGEAAYYIPAKRRSRKNITQKMTTTAIVFAVAKALCGTLPELSTLSGQGYDQSNWYEYLGMFRVLGFAVALVFGVVFLCCGLRYVGRLRAEKDYYAGLWNVYDGVMASHPDYLARRAVLLSFMYFGVGAALAVDFGLDGLSSAGGGTLGSVNIIPDVLAAILILAGLLTIKKYITKCKIPAVLASIYFFVTAAYMALQYCFAAHYYVEAVGIDPDTTSFYTLLCIVAIVCAATYIVLLIVLMRLTIAEIIRSHTGFSMTSRDTYDPTERIGQLHRELMLKTIPVICVGVIAAVLEAVSVCLVSVVDFLWIFAFVADIVYAVLFVKLLGEIKTQIDYKYMLS